VASINLVEERDICNQGYMSQSIIVASINLCRGPVNDVYWCHTYGHLCFVFISFGRLEKHDPR
jgi:hypothetical protein